MTETTTPGREPRDAARNHAAAVRPVLRLLMGFLVISVLMEILLVALTLAGRPQDVAVWIRCSLVLGSCVVVVLMARSAAAGSRAAWFRLSIVAPIVGTAIVVIVSIPGLLPGWVRVEQGLCGLLVLPAAVVLLMPRTRAAFAAAS